jgi:hypothetical protein
MAIIKPSRKFIGSDITNKNGSKYIKDGIREVSFKAKENKDGTHLYILPPYTIDRVGSGVWFKAFQIRDNFGDKFKEKYAINPRVSDPVDHFERNFKIHFPGEAKVMEVTDDQGRARKAYPMYGRKTMRVLYNVAYVNNLAAGNHILDLPSFMGASQIMEWLETKDARGKERPMLNDPTRCIPVFVKLKDGGSGNPWLITPDANDPAALPDELADSDNLYNLEEDVLEYRTPDDLIGKLKEMYRDDVFNLCMHGYPGFDGGGGSPAFIKPKASEPAVEKPSNSSKTAPAVSSGGYRKDALNQEDDIPVEIVEDEEPALGKSEAAAFLRRTKVSK